MSNLPPSYDAVAGSPKINVTAPQGQSGKQNPASPADLRRQRTNESVSSVDSREFLQARHDGMDDDERRSFDDEHRDLPEGWVRCFDPKTHHQFFVEEKTKRSTWIHPYDDPEFLRTLPDTHPANPNSIEAQNMRKRAEDEERMMKQAMDNEKGMKGKSTATSAGAGAGAGRAKGNTEQENRNWFQRKKDEMIGTKEERKRAKDEKYRLQAEQDKKIQEAQQAYMKRRQELIKQQLSDPGIRRAYASDPYGYSAPIGGYSRAGGMYNSPFGYGYGGGYGRRYGYGGYGGYGGGMGMGLPLAGGLGGGLLMGSMLGGGMGMGGFGGGFGDGGGGFDGGGGGFDGGGGGFDGGGGGGF